MSVEDLREICSGLTNKKREYRLTCEGERKVAIFFNEGPDDLNAVGFTFPIIVDIWTLGILAGNEEAGFMVCLHVYTKKQIRRGLYFEDAELKWDGIEDWEKFWTPLEAVLIKGMECRSW